MSQNVEQNVTVNNSGSSGSEILWFELLVVAGTIWWATGLWWAGAVSFILLIIATQLLIIGAALCFIPGGGIGLLAGAISNAFGAPTWACRLIGIVIGVGVSALNMEDKDEE